MVLQDEIFFFEQTLTRLFRHSSFCSFEVEKKEKNHGPLQNDTREPAPSAGGHVLSRLVGTGRVCARGGLQARTENNARVSQGKQDFSSSRSCSCQSQTFCPSLLVLGVF